MNESHDESSPIYGSRFMREEIAKAKLPERGMPAKIACQLIHNELTTQANPTLNMASFVTTVMDDECDKLISENPGINSIDTEIIVLIMTLKIDVLQS